MTTEAVPDVSDATFEDAVLGRSHEVPVVVDFWAPWCGPCRVLGPTLEQLAGEYDGRVQLVKVNVDENPMVASRYAVQSIPAVKAFRDGELATEFIGALPEPQVRAFFEMIIPSEADHEAAEGARARARGDVIGALTHLEAALAQEPDHQAASLELAELLAAGGNPAEAERAGQLASRFPADPQAKRVLGLVAFAGLAAGQDRAALEARLTEAPDDAAAHYTLGGLLALAGEWEDALEHLLATVRLDRALDDDGGRRRMLDAFATLGEEHELTAEYRRRLTNVIF
jgi:putative thioredoxin